MLVIISDLHFTDGTTSNFRAGEDLFNVKADAFRLFFSKVSNIINSKNVKDVTFIYNGDIFDQLRTYYWFDIPLEERPWAFPLSDSKKKKINGHSHTILTTIMQKNEEALSWLSGKHKDFETTFKTDASVKRVYIPGNHDRLINLNKESRKLVYASLLNKPGMSQVFDNCFTDPEHQTIVRHGHESDAYNCEVDGSGNPQYLEVPVGDPMTTMLFARLGYEAQKLKIKNKNEVVKRFKDIDNVRPYLASVRYIQEIIRDLNIEKQTKEMISKVVDEFEALPFFKDWEKRHDRINIGFDEADKLQCALGAIKLLGTSVPVGLLEKLAAFITDDSCEKLAQKYLRMPAGDNLRYVLFGHTHTPVHNPLFVHQNGPLRMEKHYLNTGTFRTTFSQTYDKQAFLRYQRMSFVTIYGPYEYKQNEEIPIYEMWSGLRMRY